MTSHKGFKPAKPWNLGSVSLSEGGRELWQQRRRPPRSRQPRRRPPRRRSNNFFNRFLRFVRKSAGVLWSPGALLFLAVIPDHIRRNVFYRPSCRVPSSPPASGRCATGGDLPTSGEGRSLTNEQMFDSLCPPPLLACVLLPEARPKGSPRNHQISWGNKEERCRNCSSNTPYPRLGSALAARR